VDVRTVRSNNIVSALSSVDEQLFKNSSYGGIRYFNILL